MRSCCFVALVGALLLFSILPVHAQKSSTAWTPEFQVKTRALGSPDISPDGKSVVYTVSDPLITPEKSEFLTQIWMASTDGRENRQITFGEKSSGNPKWSPDGTMIAFTSNRRDNKNNIFLLRVAGGEAEQLTDVKSGVADFKWSPDGKWIAFTMTDPRTEEEEKNSKGRNDFRWVDENVKLARIFLISVEPNAEGKREPKKLTTEDRHVTSFDWSPDGARIVFSHVKSPVVDHWPTSDVSVVDINSGKTTPFAATEASETAPLYSPDGKWVAVSVSEHPTRWAQSNRLHIFPANGGTARIMPQSPDGQPNTIGWTADGGKIYFTEAKGTVTGLYELDIAAGKISEPHPGQAVFASVTMNRSGVFAGVAQTASMPPELYAGRLTDPSPVKVSNANGDRASIPVGKTELIKWKSADGLEIEGLLTYPEGYQTGQKVPLILNVHGGPAGVFQQSYIGGRGAYPLATFASKGYAILRPNPRGSSGYGVAFRRANIKDWAGKDFEDLMAGVDYVIAMGVADPERLGVMGWSYGGYMTSMIITKTTRFKAASAGAPVTNLMSFTGTADIPSFIPDYFEAEFWENPEIYAQHSAIFNIRNARTPTMIQHGEADVRVPISQGYELYTALKRQGVPTRMIVLPRQPHGPNEPKMQIAAMQSNLEWFDKYLK